MKTTINTYLITKTNFNSKPQVPHWMVYMVNSLMNVTIIETILYFYGFNVTCFEEFRLGWTINETVEKLT